MPTKKTVDGCNISCVGYDVDSEGSMCTIWCKICREFYNEMKNNTGSSSVKGVGQMGKFFYYCIGLKNINRIIFVFFYRKLLCLLPISYYYF